MTRAQNVEAESLSETLEALYKSLRPNIRITI